MRCSNDARPCVNTTMLEAARHGDRQAQTELLRALQDPWYRVCYSILRDAEAARDATQETALRFLRQLPSFRGESQLRTWALGIAINVAREMQRSNRPIDAMRLVKPTDSNPWVLKPDDRAESSEQNEALHAVLESLPQRQREAITLRYFEELSVEQTASAMQCAVGTVKATIHQALRNLKDRMRQYR